MRQPLRGYARNVNDSMMSTGDLKQYGRSLRGTIRRRDHARFTVPQRDPVAILEAQNADRVPDLVPVRMGRMLQTPFTYYRGTAAVMAHDLRDEPVTGVQVVCCGDAHISNFGLFASPERRVIFDLNDFDEASNAPWEWDVKRLAASIILGGRDKGLSNRACRETTQEAVRVYRRSLHRLSEMTALERYYFQVDTDQIERLAGGHSGLVRKSAQKARRRTSDQVLAKMTTTCDDAGLHIIDVPPVTRHVDHLSVEILAELLEQYRNSLRADTALLLAQFELVDFVLRVVGVGSVGTRCYVVMFVGPSGEPLFLQVKEAPPSVLESHGGQRCRIEHLPPAGAGQQGYRVVSGQRILQAQSDPFLGWIRNVNASDGKGGTVVRDFYVRQFRDMKGTLDTEAMSDSEYQAYVSLCAGLLARGHSQSPRAAALTGYLGQSDKFDKAVTGWAVAYADQCERDFEALKAAERSGRLAVQHGV